MKSWQIRWNSRSFLVVALNIAVLMALLLLPGTSAALPAEPDAVAPTNASGIEAGMPAIAPLADDGGPWEVGAEAAGGNLAGYASGEATALFNRLKSCGWTGRFNYSTALAWEEDFKRLAGPGGGKEHLYLDTVDLMFYIGHGSTGGFTFDNWHDDTVLTPSDCNRSWGDGDNDWVALTSCQVLGDANLWPWSQCMNGGHLILGFQTNANANNPFSSQGYYFADYICQGWTVAAAWYKACDRSQPAGRVVRSLINELAYLNDRPMCGAAVCPLAADSYDTDAWVQTHVCGSEQPGPVPYELLNGRMPVFQTAPLSLAEAQSQYTHLGAVFGVRPTDIAAKGLSEGGVWRDVTDGRELEMDRYAGLYGFYDMNRLWTTQQAEQAFRVQAAAVPQGDVRGTADAFLNANNLMPGDARFFETVADTISGGQPQGSGSAAVSASLLADEQPVVWQAVYARVVSYTVPAAQGLGDNTVEFVVTGPGAKQKVYVNTATTAADGSAEPTILGVIGGWRNLQEPGRTQSQSIDTVPILTQQQIYKLHEQAEKLVVLNPPPTDADGRQVISHTLAYWEDGVGVTQSELTPVYALFVRYTKGIQELSLDFAYIPANNTYMRPLAQIESLPPGAVGVGSSIQLRATDASKTLAELGYDASLNFALGSGDYSYDWFFDSVSEANRLGSGRTLSYVVRSDVVNHGGQLQQNIILQVTDIGPRGDHRSSTTTLALDVKPRLLLPLILKN